MWNFFIKNEKFAYLFLVALLAVGSYSLIVIPKESSPEVVIPVGVVSVVFPGAPAIDVEALVTNEIERGLGSLNKVKKITSTSREGFSSVVVEFEADAELDKSIQDLKDKIDTIKIDLPDDAEEPTVSEVNFVDQPVLTISLSGELSDFEFTELTNQLETEVESVSGVSRVEFQGVRDREVTVIVDQIKLQHFELSLQDVMNGIRNANLAFPVGQIVNDGIIYNVAFEGDITDSSVIGNVPIATRSLQPIFVRDIAIIEDGLKPATSLSRLSVGGDPSENAVTLNVYKQTGDDITRITAAVNAKIKSLQEPGKMLDGVTAVTVLDSGKEIKDELARLSSSGVQTVILVVLLLVAAIGWREGLLAGTAVPLTFLFGFIGLNFSDNTINFLSLFSLILGIGILVDSAIVMVEAINRKMRERPTIDKKQAAIEAVDEFAAPLISGTLTTVAMFSGLFIVSGVTGQFISSIPFTLIFLLFASLFVALAIIPLFAATFLHPQTTSRLEEKQLVFAKKLESWYRTKLELYIYDEHRQQNFIALLISGLVLALSVVVNIYAGLIAAPLIYVLSLKIRELQQKRSWPNWKRGLVWYPSFVIVIGVTFTVVGIILPTYNPVKVAFFEQSDNDFVVVELENPEGTAKEVTDIAIRRVEEFLYDETEIESFTITVGSGSQFGSNGNGPKFANIFINLSKDRSRTSSEIVEDLRAQLTQLNDLKVVVSQPSGGPPAGAAIIVKFLGDDLAVMNKLANDSAEIFKKVPGTVNVQTSTNNNSTEFVFELDREKAAAAGLDPFVVSQTLRTAVYGSKATSLTTLTDDISVVVKLNINNSDTVTNDTANITSIDALEQIMIPGRAGMVPLSSLIKTNLREHSSSVTHEDGRRVVTVTADVVAGANAREIQAIALEQVKSKLSIPDDVEISTGGGETEESNKAFLEMFFAMVIGVLLMVGILVLQFNSYLHMRYVLSILPYSLIGVLFGLAITLNPISFPSIMGFIALSGIVVNNSILLIDMMNRTRQEQPTKKIHEVVLDAAASRIRPILLTTTTTVIGMIPLTYAGDLWAPLAYSVMFGLIFSVIITLILVPILYIRKPGKLG